MSDSEGLIDPVAPGTMCPLCHTVPVGVTAADLASGAGWKCTVCDTYWDGIRLATVAAYARYVEERARLSLPSGAETSRWP